MKTWMLVPCLLLATVLVAQTNSPTETNLPPANTQTNFSIGGTPAAGVPAGLENGREHGSRQANRVWECPGLLETEIR